MSEYMLTHHGILGQHWGVRNGPPYPLKGRVFKGSYVIKKRDKLKRHDIYDKRYKDKIVKKNKKISTLSYDPDRTKNTDMFFATYTFSDKHRYNSRFNNKLSQDVYDEKGAYIGKDTSYKMRITSVLSKDIKVASEQSSAKVFGNLYQNDRNFSNFVTDPNRLRSYFDSSKYKFKGYRESLATLEKMDKPDYVPTADDMQKVYRMFNYVIPNDGRGDQRVAKDVLTNRTKFFNELKKQGYDATLDTNDALYGGYKAQSPIIVFNMESIAKSYAKKTTKAGKVPSYIIDYTNSILGR